MIWKKIKRWSKVLFLLAYGIFSLFVVLFLGFMIFLTVSNKSALVDSATINSISMYIAFVSLPGILMSLFTMVDFNKKKKFKATNICPHCKHKYDFSIEEE